MTRRGGPRPVAHAGLLTAVKRARFAPDPPNLAHVTGNNAGALRHLAKVVDALCGGRPGTRFYIGSVSAGMVFGVSHVTMRNRLRQLEDAGVIRTVWLGRRTRTDPTGRPLPAGRTEDKGTEFVYLGLPSTLRRKPKNL